VAGADAVGNDAFDLGWQAGAIQPVGIREIRDPIRGAFGLGVMTGGTGAPIDRTATADREIELRAISADLVDVGPQQGRVRG